MCKGLGMVVKRRLRVTCIEVEKEVTVDVYVYLITDVVIVS